MSLKVRFYQLSKTSSDPLAGQCLSITSYEKLNQLGEGTYGVVYRARDRETSRVVALKQVRILPEERQNGVPMTALREISILRSLGHDNIINVSDVAVGTHEMDEVYMIMEYAEQVGSPMLRIPRHFQSIGAPGCHLP